MSDKIDVPFTTTTTGGAYTTTDGHGNVTYTGNSPWYTTPLPYVTPPMPIPNPEPAKLGLAYITELVSMQIGETREINGRDYLRLPHGWLLCEHDVVIPPFTKGESDESEE